MSCPDSDDIIANVLLTTVERDGLAPAVLNTDGSTNLTYRQLLQQVTNLAVDLRRSGVIPGDAVLVSLNNGSDFLVAILATMVTAISMPMNPQYSLDELERHAEDLSVKAVITESSSVAPQQFAVARNLPILFPRKDSSEADAINLLAFGQSSNDVALMLHTAGTTSQPKQVPLSHRNIVAACRNVVTSLGLTSDDRCLNVMPLFHSHGLLGATLSSIVAGASTVLPESMDPRFFITWASDTRATWYTAAPTIHQLALQSPGEYTGFRFIRSASGPLAPNIAHALEARLRAPVIEVYGMTEAYQIAANPLPPRQRRIGTVGQATGTEVRVVNSLGSEAGIDEEGEIVVRGPAVFSGYHSPLEANDSAFLDGWFRTGDLGTLDSDRFLTITGRIKEQINRGGEKISPREIDEALLNHPDILDAMAFAYPDSVMGEEIGAALVLRPGTRIDLVDVRRFLRERISPFKIPKIITTVDSLPRSSTGKLLRTGFATRHMSQIKEPSTPSSTPPVEDENVISRLKTIWADLLGQAPTAEDVFFDLGGTSLLAIELIIRIEEEFGVELSAMDVLKVPSLAGLSQRINEDRQDNSSNTLLHPIRPDRGGIPVILVTGAEGVSLGMAHIAKALPVRFEPFLFDYPGHTSGSQPRETIEDIAEVLIGEIDHVAPGRPLVLYGNSLGGWIVFEAARILAKVGRDPILVGIGDMYSPVLNSRSSPLRPSFNHRVRNRLQRLRISAKIDDGSHHNERTSAISHRHRSILKASQLARRRYRVKPYSGPVFVFTARERREKYGPTLCWDQNVNGTLQSFPLDSLHSVMHIQDAETIAQTIDECVPHAPSTAINNLRG